MALAIEHDKASNPTAKSPRRAGVLMLDLDCVADSGKQRDGRNCPRKMEPFGPRIADQNGDFRELSAKALSTIWSNLDDKPGGSAPIRPGVVEPHISLGLMTVAPVLNDLREPAWSVATANGGNRASLAGRARTESRLVARLPAPTSLSSPLAAARCAFTPRACASIIRALAAGGRRRITSSPCLQHRHSGRRLAGQHRPEFRPRARITELWPNPAFERTRRGSDSTWRRCGGAPLNWYVRPHENNFRESAP